MKTKTLMKARLLFLLGVLTIGIVTIINIPSSGKDSKEESIENIQAFPITTLTVKNSNQTDTITVYLTIGGCLTCINNVNGIFGITQTGLQGSFTLNPNQSLSYKAPKGKAFSGNVSFLNPPINCPNGTTICEFELNNYSRKIKSGQETVEISCVSGVTYIAKYTMNGGGSWTATTGYENIKTFHNDTIGANSGLVGVYPYGCDDCTSQSSGAPSCTIGKNETPQTLPICNISRNAKQSGGTVVIEYIKPVN